MKPIGQKIDGRNWRHRLADLIRPPLVAASPAARTAAPSTPEPSAAASPDAALHLAQARLATAQRIGQIGHWDFDNTTGQVWWSEQTYRIYGLEPDPTGAYGGGFAGVLGHVHPDDRVAFEAAQAKFFAGQQSLDLEHRIVRADGAVRWVHGLGEARLDAQGRLLTLSGTVQDITARKLADEALRASEAQFHLLTDAMPQIVCMLRADGWLTYFNQRWMDYTGLSMADSLGQGWSGLIHPEDASRVLALWARAPEGQGPTEMEFRLRRSDGAYRWMLGRAHPLQSGTGPDMKWLGTFTDIDDLKQATAQLQANLTITRIAGRVARLGGWTIDLADKKLTWSDENCVIHEVEPGYQPTLEEGIGYFLPEHRSIVERHVRDCAEHGTPYEFILPKMTTKGRRIWVRSIGEAVRDESGKIVRLQGAFQDISELKQAEARTAALETQLSNTLESITDGFSLLDKEGRFTYLNSQAERMLRRRRQDLLGRTLWAEFPLVADSGLAHDFKAAVAAQRSDRFEAYYRPLKTWFVFHVYPTEAGTAVYFQDITKTREDQSQLRLLETAVSRLNDIVIIARAQPGRPDPRIVFVNPAFERHTGYTPAEAVGQSTAFLWGPKSQGPALDRINAALSGGQPVRTEIVNYTKAGQERWVEIEMAPMAQPDGTVTHWVVVERDITERLQQRHEILRLNAGLEQRVQLRTAQLAEANKELESFAYSVSHDLRSPLNTIHAFSQLLQKKDVAQVTEKGQHYLDRIGAGVVQMGNLIEGLLTLAHLSREEIRSETVDLSALAQQIESDQRAREPQRQVQTHIEPGLTAQGDPRLLAAVLQNLLGNAWKFSAKKPQAVIEVGSRPGADGHTVYHVKDNGAGFDMAFAHKLFGTFERLHSPGDFDGTGIGLATVKRVVERHGGKVWAEGKPGEGAVFYFTLNTPAPTNPH